MLTTTNAAHPIADTVILASVLFTWVRNAEPRGVVQRIVTEICTSVVTPGVGVTGQDVGDSEDVTYKPGDRNGQDNLKYNAKTVSLIMKSWEDISHV